MNVRDYDAFARLLDGDLPEGEATAEARVLSGFAQALQASAAVPRMESKDQLRMALVEAARAQAATPSLLTRMRQTVDDTTSRWRYSMRAAAASGAAAMALSSGGVALAAHRAMPDDLFYGAKLAFEDIRLAFISDPVARAEQLFAYANQRILEAEIAAAEGDMASAQRALAEADTSSRSAAGYLIRASQDRGDPSLLTLLDDFAEANRKRLAALLPLLSGDAVTAAEDAMVGLRRISQRLAVLSGPCAECGAQPGTKPGGRSAQGKREAAAAADPDFDFADIPPASEPFAACPCVTGPTTVDAKPNAGKPRTRDGGRTVEKPDGATGTGDEPGDDPKEPTDPGDGPGDGPGGEDPRDEDPTVIDEAPLPDEVKDPVKDAEDVIQDVIDDAPSDVPDLPIDPTGLPLP